MVDRRGRPGKSANLHRLHGTTPSARGAIGDNGGPSLATAKLPDPPAWLNDLAVEEWNRQGPIAVELGLLGPVYRGVFTAYCQAFGNWARASILLNDAALELKPDGSTEEKIEFLTSTPNGYAVYSPLLTIMQKERERFVAYAAELGFTPSSLMRAKAGTLQLEMFGNEAEAYFNKKKGAAA